MKYAYRNIDIDAVADVGDSSTADVRVAFVAGLTSWKCAADVRFAGSQATAPPPLFVLRVVSILV